MGLLLGGGNLRSSYVNREKMGHVLALLMPTNRLVMRVCIHTGLRVGDVLAIKTKALKSPMTVREAKTGKSRRVYIPRPMLEEMQEQAGRIWVFESRTDVKKHRTRQAVYKDVARAAAALRRSGAVPKAAVVSPHSARKLAAVEAYKVGGLEAAGKLLNHSDPAVTMIYALADQLQTMDKTPRSRRAKHGKV